DIRDFVWADFDNDGAPDAAMVDADDNVHVFTNERGGRFVDGEVTRTRGVALAAGDGDGDGIVDVLVLEADGNVRVLQITTRGGWQATTVTDPRTAAPTGSNAAGWASLVAADVDNNGASDLIVSLPQLSRVLLADASRKYVVSSVKPS